MNIRSASESNIIEEIKKPNFLSEVSSLIFSICKTSDEFKSKNDTLKTNDDELSTLDRKINKQDSLLIKAESMKESYTEKNKLLDNENLEMRARLLEQLGSEL